MTGERPVSGPAWSGAFEPDRLTSVTPLPIDDEAREWAWDGSTGAGIKGLKVAFTASLLQSKRSGL